MGCDFRKSINIWSFEENLSIIQCMKMAKKAGFEGIELVLNRDGNLSLDSNDDEILSYRNAADEIGIHITSLATGLYWQYSITSNSNQIQDKAKEIVRRQIDIGKLLGVDSILVVPGSVGVDFKPSEVVPNARDDDFFAGSEIIDYDIAYDRSVSAFKELALYAEEKKVIIGIENVWNKFLLSPLEMREFIDEINSPWVQVYLDVANMMLYGYPEHWIKILGTRIKAVHFKDYRTAAGGLSGFVDLLAGDVNFTKVVSELEKINYTGWVNAEMTPSYKQYTDQIVYNTSASMDRILKR
ncbi:sugar phosphate isomerase/epimerase family protein [Virgibacillus sp. W0430]|uniref:sugar phosphate isomerase/epimerase family protein n=1 Tax=Virgibacillus sp. W0430 TaxID=3391580 RepID=UPI003F45740C